MKYAVGTRLLTTPAFRDKHDVYAKTPAVVREYDSILNYYRVKIETDQKFAPEHVTVTAEMMPIYFELDVERVTVPAVLFGWYKQVERYIR